MQNKMIEKRKKKETPKRCSPVSDSDGQASCLAHRTASLRGAGFPWCLSSCVAGGPLRRWRRRRRIAGRRIWKPNRDGGRGCLRLCLGSDSVCGSGRRTESGIPRSCSRRRRRHSLSLCRIRRRRWGAALGEAEGAVAWLIYRGGGF